MNNGSPSTPTPGYSTPIMHGTPGTPGYSTPQGKRTKTTKTPIKLLDLDEIKIPSDIQQINLAQPISRVTSSTGENSCIYESDICSTEPTSKQYISKVVTEKEAKKIIRS